MAMPIKTRLRLLFSKSETDVTESILPDLLSFSFDDKETNEADEISLTLKDEKGKWSSNWQPNGGEVIRAYIANGTVTKQGHELFCGRFYVDSIRASGSSSGRQVEIRGVSIPLDKPIRRKAKTRAWEKQTLKEIAQTIANENGMKLLFDCEENAALDRQDQSKESDLKFLSRLSEDAGLSIKVTDEKIVIFDQSHYEKKKPIKTMTLGKSPILSWDFESCQSDTYKSVSISYRDPKQKRKFNEGSQNIKVDNASNKQWLNCTVVHTEIDPLIDENGQEYTMKQRATSIEEARRLAKAKLRELNRRQVTGSMSVIGDVSLVAGVVIACEGFGKFDGNYYLESASHSMSSSGYVTNVSLVRVNKNY